MKTLSTRLRAIILACLTGALILGVAAPAFGHASVNLYGSTPKADGYGAFWVRIGHGCVDAKGKPLAVNKVTVTLPGAFQSGKPQQLDDWKSSVVQLKNNGGYRLQWIATGDALRDDEFQDFGISTKYPANAGTYRVPTVQYCGAAKIAWVEQGHDADHPAATIAVGTAAASSH
jgi:uncharacterized protein YcnI